MHPYETSLKLPDKDCQVKVTYKDGFSGETLLWWVPQANVQAFWDRKFKNGKVIETTAVWWRWLEDFEVITQL